MAAEPLLQAPQSRSVRQRIGSVMKWAIAQGLRMDNPRARRFPLHCRKTPPCKSTSAHYRTPEVGAALRRVRGCDAYQAIRLAFESLVLTATRSDEASLVL